MRRRWTFPRPASCLDGAVWTAIAGILATAAWTALASPPNSVDAFGYHLSRVAWWARQGAVAFFPTHYYPQVSMPPMAEYAMLHGWVLAGGDRFAFHLEYPLQVFLLRLDPGVRWSHTGVRNATARYARSGAKPCAVVCLGCPGDAGKMAEYASYGAPATAGRLLVYRRAGPPDRNEP